MNGTYLAPGYERDLKLRNWNWNINVSAVYEGHDCVTLTERSLAKKLGAKLTFGEVLEPGVVKLLHNLDIENASRFHDLGCGTAKLLIQAYLSHSHLRKCLGVELAEGRYDLAVRNIESLLEFGYLGRHFIKIEERKKQFLTIVECKENKSFSEGANVTAFNPNLRTDKNHFPNYDATIIEKIDNTYTVEYTDGTIVENLHQQYIFLPEDVHLLEIYCGSLFNYPGAWMCDVCILETDFPTETHQQLMQGIVSSPIGCRFLTYHNLKRLKAYKHAHIRQLDVNVFDNDRYPSSWSQGWRFFLWEHVPNPTEKILPEHIGHLKKFKYIIVAYQDSNRVMKLTSVDEENSCIKVCDPRNSSAIEIIDPFYTNVYCPGFSFDIGDRVCSYWPHNVQTNFASQYELFYGTIDSITLRGYTIIFDDGDVAFDVDPKWVFSSCKFLFQLNDQVCACWPPNAQNKNCPERYRTFPGTITARNADGTYGVEFYDGLTAPHVREMWIKLIPQDFTEEKENCVLPPDPNRAYHWDVDTVCRWVRLLGIPMEVVEQFRSLGVNGQVLLNLTRNELIRLDLNKKQTHLLTNKIYRLKNPVNVEGVKVRQIYKNTNAKQCMCLSV